MQTKTKQNRDVMSKGFPKTAKEYKKACKMMPQSVPNFMDDNEPTKYDFFPIKDGTVPAKQPQMPPLPANDIM